jgi:alkanesulfonate monooxygenase SsuD/methylene tetrahydromethanopterin reductase-like flavin-dependent oxidoreductase (luciferase family)
VPRRGLRDGRHPDRRIIFGVGRGYHTREVETFGNPLIDQNANREMFEEGIEVLFSHQGKYWTIPPEVPYRGYTLKEITLMPAPERLPVECAAATRARLLHDAQAPPQCGGRG